MKNKKVVVTGGAGFIGSNIVQELAKENKVIVIDNLSTGNIGNIKEEINQRKVDFIEGSITNLKLLEKTFEDIDYVFHQAAVVSIPYSIDNPIETNNVNIGGTLNVLSAASKNNVKKVVFASSCAVYGNPTDLPIRETAQINPLAPYTISKIVGEYYCKIFTDLFNLPTVCLRYFNVYGPRQDPNSAYAAAIPKFIDLVLKNKQPTIFGDGTQTRDFIFVKDVTKANTIAAESKRTGVFNIASGEKISINDLAKKIIEINNKELKPIYKEKRKGDIKDSLADVSKASKELNFKADYKLGKGLKETIKWFS